MISTRSLSRGKRMSKASVKFVLGLLLAAIVFIGAAGSIATAEEDTAGDPNGVVLAE
jgi:hypothetical protein